jgi:hypothetical protein
MDEREVVDVARAMRPHLGALLGPEAGEVDGELASLLRRSDHGQAVKTDVLRVIGRFDATREWAHRLLEVAAGDRAYQPVPGAVQRITVPRYVCPRYTECGIDFYRFSSAEPVPPCRVHGIPLVEWVV